MFYAAIVPRLPVELRNQVDSFLEPADAVAMLRVSKNLNTLTNESPLLLRKMLEEKGRLVKSLSEKLQAMRVQQSGLVSSLVRSEHENALRSTREENMSDSMSFQMGQLQTVRQELEEERTERNRQAAMNAMLMEDLRLRSWQESYKALEPWAAGADWRGSPTALK